MLSGPNSNHHLETTVYRPLAITVIVNYYASLHPMPSSGASGGCLHGGASFKVEKAHFAAQKKGPENSKN